MSKKLLIVVNSPLFVLQHLRQLLRNPACSGYSVLVATACDLRYLPAIDGVAFARIPIAREPSFIDFFSLVSLAWLRFSIRPDVVLSFTPKAGFLNALTFLFPGISVHYFTGQRWANFFGLKRSFFMFTDKIICILCSHVLADSFSQAKFLAESLNVNRPVVIGPGSVSGVDLSLFRPSSRNPFLSCLHSLAADLQRSGVYDQFVSLSNAWIANVNRPFVFGFVGRINKDKGVVELLRAFAKLRVASECGGRRLILLLIGPLELSKSEEKLLSDLRHAVDVFCIGYVESVHHLYPCLDCLVLPSYREGFGGVLLEGAACGVPLIASDIPGPRDFIENELTGLLVKPRDVVSLYDAMLSLLVCQSMRGMISANALNLVTTKFSHHRIRLDFFSFLDSISRS